MLLQVYQRGELLEDVIKQESPFQSEVTSEALLDNVYDSNNNNNNLWGYMNDNHMLPNAFSAGNQIPNWSNFGDSVSQTPSLGSNTGSGTGIKLRTRQPMSESVARGVEGQGTAPRRIRLQTRFQIGLEQCGLPKASNDNEGNSSLTEVSHL